MGDFLKREIRDEFCNTINGTTLFTYSEKYSKEHYNLFGAIIHRVKTCTGYLNQHSQYPKSEEDFICFLTYADMLFCAVHEILKKLDIKNPYSDKHDLNSYIYFRNVRWDSPKTKEENLYVIDDKFFRYIRALALAHPFGTNQHKSYLVDGEIQYSPFVLANNFGTRLRNVVDSAVGVRVYTNKQDEQFSIVFSFENLKQFLSSRYELLKLATTAISNIIKKQETEWNKRKVKRDLSSIEVLQDIKFILIERYEGNGLDDLIGYLSCPLSKESNHKAVKQYRQVICDGIPEMCDAIDSMEYKKFYEVTNMAYISPKETHDKFHYQMEKIFSYEIDYRTIEQAVEFSQGFAKKWVTIDVDNMQIEEIRLLVRTACYLEWLEQEENK